MARLIAESIGRTVSTTMAGAAALLLGGASPAVAGASAAQARAAFALDRAAPEDAGSLHDFVVARMKQSDLTASASSRGDAACQQAARFAAFLHDANPGAFARMMTAILAGHPFVEAVRMGYGTNASLLWERFAH
jgi:hypothetical protein